VREELAAVKINRLTGVRTSGEKQLNSVESDPIKLKLAGRQPQRYR